MDDGETLMKTGDVLVQRGTNHAWANRSSKTARICLVLIDGSARRAPPARAGREVCHSAF